MQRICKWPVIPFIIVTAQLTWIAIPKLVLHLEDHRYMSLRDSPYAGPPNPEIDYAWEALLETMNTRVSKEELQAHGQVSIQLPEGGFLAWLGVYHQLHCIVSFRVCSRNQLTSRPENVTSTQLP